MGKFLYTSFACTHIFIHRSNISSIVVVLLKRSCPEYLMQHNKSITKLNAEDFDGLLELRRKRRFTAPPTGVIRRWPSVYCTNNKITSALRIKQYFDELLKLIFSHEPVLCLKRQCKITHKFRLFYPIPPSIGLFVKNYMYYNSDVYFLLLLFPLIYICVRYHLTTKY